jgi:tetratricopeptide (TPR) repeat protein
VARRIHRAYPEDFWANYDLAGCLHHRNQPRPEEAVRYYGAALALRPHNPAVCISLGNALSALGKLDAAISTYREALDRHPEYTAAHERLALALESKGDLDGAITEIRETIRLGGAARQHCGDHVVLGRLLQRKGLRDEALAEFRLALEQDPRNWACWCIAATLHAAAGDVAGYRRACRGVLEWSGDTNQPVIAERTARACLLLPDALSGAEFYRVRKLAAQAVTGTEKHPYYRSFVLANGLAEYRAGHHAEAGKWLQRFAPNASGAHWDATAFAALAMAYHQLGKEDDAETALAKAKSIVAQKMPGPASGRPFGAGDWHDWLHAQVLCREATELLKKESGVKNQEPGKKSD